MRPRILGRALATLGLTLLAGLTIALLLGISVDASRWRDAVGARVSAALGQPVSLAGPLRIRLGTEIGIDARDIRVGAAPGPGVPPLATIDSLRAAMSLLDALRGRPHLRLLEIDGVRVHVAGAADRSSGAIGSPASAPDKGNAPVIEAFSLRNATLDLAGPAGAAPERLLEIESLVGTLRAGAPLALEGRARLRGAPPCTVSLLGPGGDALLRAGGEWPAALDLTCAHTTLHAEGTVAPGAGGARLDIGLGATDLGELARVLGTSLPDTGPLAVAARVTLTPQSIALADLRGAVGATGFAGALTLDRSAPRPRLAGELRAEVIDAHAWIARPADAAVDWRSRPLARGGPLPLDAGIAVRAARVLGLPVDVTDVRLDLEADARGLRAPLAATLAGVPVTGAGAMDIAGDRVSVSLEAHAREVDLAALPADAAGFEGEVGRFSLHVAGSGATLGALASDIDARLAIADARLRHTGGARPWPVDVKTLDIVLPRGGALRGTAQGTLDGEPARFALRGATLAEMLARDTLPFDARLELRGARATLAGTANPAAPGWATTARFGLAAPRAGALARWLPLAPEAALPLDLRGRVVVRDDDWRIDDAVLSLGRSTLTVDVRRDLVAGRRVTVLSARGPLLDLPELATLRAAPPPSGARPAARTLDAPILPTHLALADADIGLGVDRLVLGRIEIAHAGVALRTRDGQLERSPFAGKLGGSPFEGHLAADLRDAAPAFSLSLAAQDLDVGALMRRLGVADIVEERAERFEAEIAARGATLRELLETASLDARLSGGRLEVRRHALPTAALRVDDVTLAARAGEPLTASVNGEMADETVTLALRTGTLAQLAAPGSRMPFSLEGRAAGTRLALEGEARVPLGSGGELELALEGERLDTLADLLGTALPAWGPWSVRGPVSLTAKGHGLARLTARVGGTELTGSGELDLSGARPRIDVRLRAPEIQLDDFPVEALQAEPVAIRGQEDLRSTAGAAARETQRVLAARFLRRFDGTLDVAVDRILSGADRLADGMLRARLEAGTLTLDPLVVNIPGGSARLKATHDVAGDGIAMALDARVERFDYGVIARRIRPGSDVAGLISLDLKLAGRPPSIDRFLAHADGRFDFAIWPQNLPSGVLDRWSINAFATLLPFLLRPGDSTVNCYIGRADFAGGGLTEDKLLIDTTRVRATGTGYADFATEEISFRFNPRAKGVTFFSLQTPLRVEGTMRDFRVFAAPGDWLEAVARFFGSVVLVPLEIWRNGPLPADGADVCTDPIRPR